jgi:preprotein translocase subunit SecG
VYSFLVVILILDALILAVAILLQAGKGGGLASSFGGTSSSTDSLLGTRQAGNILTKASWWGGAIFIALAFILQIMSTRSRVPTSILDQALTPSTAPATAPGLGTAPEQGIQSAVPLEPAPAAPPAKQP